jgi:hypothetical protein
MTAHFPFDNSYARLPDRFFTRQPPVPVEAPGLIAVNHALAERLGLTCRGRHRDRRDLRRKRDPRGGGAAGAGLCRAPVRRLGAAAGRRARGPAGRGRGARWRALRHPAQGRGAHALFPHGRRARVARPVLREYIVSEAMACPWHPHHPGAGRRRHRRDRAARGADARAVLARVAASHIRVGTFQYFAARQDRRRCGRWPITPSRAITRTPRDPLAC